MLTECLNCHGRYDWNKSPSNLPLSYCNTLCEVAYLGASIVDIEKAAEARISRGPAVIRLRRRVLDRH